MLAKKKEVIKRHKTRARQIIKVITRKNNFVIAKRILFIPPILRSSDQ